VAQLYHRVGLDGDAENYLRAHEKDAVAALKGREKEALCAMYGELGRAARLYRIAAEAVPGAMLTRAPSKASEWAWKCLYPRPYEGRVQDLEAREGLPKGLIYAVMRQESAYDPDAVSGARAVGLLQLMPETAKRVAAEAGTPFDEKLLRTPAVNLDLGARYLAKMLHTFQGSVPMAAAAYNAGPRAVHKWLERVRGVDLDVWVALIPFEETRTYVNKVMSNLARYAYIEGGESAVSTVDLSLPAPAHPKEESAEY
jgi:soluble lytic murein transglycosylase